MNEALAITEDELELQGQPVLVRRAGDADVPVLYLHDVPSSGADFEGLLARTGGLAPDLLGFGRSGKRGDLDFSPPGLARFVGEVLDLLEVDRVRLCVHGFGAVGLLWAMEHPERVERLVVVNGLPLLPDFAWDRQGRLLRGPMTGELMVGFMTAKRVLRRYLRPLCAPGSELPDELSKRMGKDFDQGTQRALMRLYRAAAPEHLGEYASGLQAIDAPALVLWGALDPVFTVPFGRAYSGALGDAVFEEVSGAGRWPWLEDDAAADRIVQFLSA